MGIRRTPTASRAGLPLFVCLLLLGACAQAPSASAPVASAVSVASAAPASRAAFPATLADDVGREVTMAAPAQRVVSLAPSNTEIVCALDACDRLVGVTDFDDYPPEVVDVDDVVISAQVDVELVVAAEPDLVLAAGNELTPTAVIEQLDGLGLTVLVLYAGSLEAVYRDIELVGAALGRSAEAERLVERMQADAAETVDAVAGADRPRTLYETFYAEGTTYTAGEGSFLASLVDAAGGDPVTGDAEGALSAEDLVAADPELILLGTARYDPSLSTTEAALATLRGRPGWEALTAVQQGAVVPYTEDIVTTRPGPRIVEGLAALARAIHPERFE